MGYRFQKHYTLEEARSLLPEIRQWLRRLQELTRQLETAEAHFGVRLREGWDLGGSSVNEWIRNLLRCQEFISEFENREILIKDIHRGLIDFPAFLEGREVFLCWEQDEEDIGFWHDIDAGYAGRTPLE